MVDGLCGPESPGCVAAGDPHNPQPNLRLKVPSWLHPSRVFPRGFPEEFALVLTLLLKKNSPQSTWYLFQVTDGEGYPQVSPAATLTALLASQL